MERSARLQAKRKMKRLKPVNVVIVGGGWTGLAMAKEITSRTALNVLVLERGAPRKSTEYAEGMDELDYAIRVRMMQNIADETITHRHSTKDPAAPVRQYGSFLPGSGTGGAGEHWNGTAFRWLETIFTMNSHLKEKFGATHLPENLDVRDWGITYADLEKHYWKAEAMMGVSGKAGNIKGQKSPGGNPFEGPRESEYPLPPLKTSYAGLQFAEGARKLGYSPYPLPAANLSETYKNPDGITRAACMYCGYCERFGCMVGAKAQPTNTLMPILNKTKSFSMKHGAWVRRVITKSGHNKSSHAVGVQYTDMATGEEFFQPADAVFLGTFTLNNFKILSLSKIGTPYDAATGKGTLGRHLTHQTMGFETQLFFDKPMNLFMGTGSLGMMISDFDGSHAFTPNDKIVRGGTISLSTNGNRPITTFGAAPAGAAKSNWGSEWKNAGVEWRDRVANIGYIGEHMAYKTNFMDLDPTYQDKMGDPLVRFTLDWTEHEFQQRVQAAGIQGKIAEAMGLRYRTAPITKTKYNVIGYQSTHIQGGCIMGTSPENSVVDTNLGHWDVRNLYVMGASSFPQNASANPTMTALATMYRAADAFIAGHNGQKA